MITTTSETLCTAWRLHFTDAKSDKFYNIYALSDGHLILHWGRSGSIGQTKVEVYTSDEAIIIAKRQAYAKAGKGYKFLTDEYPYTLSEAEANRGKAGQASTLERALHLANQQSEFTQRQRLVTSHYDQFIAETSKVLDSAAAGADFENLLAQWESLSKSWKELDEKHAHALASVEMAQRVVHQAMMGGK